MPRSPIRLFARGSAGESRRIAELLRGETTGGVLLIVAALIAIVWANTPASHAYETLRSLGVGPAALPLDLTLSSWASDGLLAIFFVAGRRRECGRLDGTGQCAA